MRVTVIATGFDQSILSAAPKAAPQAAAATAPAAPAEQPVVAPRTGDIGDIDEIFSIFKR